MRAEGISPTEISKRLGIGRASVYRDSGSLHLMQVTRRWRVCSANSGALARAKDEGPWCFPKVNQDEGVTSSSWDISPEELPS